MQSSSTYSLCFAKLSSLLGQCFVLPTKVVQDFDNLLHSYLWNGKLDSVGGAKVA